MCPQTQQQAQQVFYQGSTPLALRLGTSWRGATDVSTAESLGLGQFGEASARLPRPLSDWHGPSSRLSGRYQCGSFLQILRSIPAPVFV